MDKEHLRDSSDGRADHRNRKALMRKRKGWIGFVHGYSDWVKNVCETGKWEKIKWGKGTKSAKEEYTIQEGALTKKVYKFD